MGDAGGKRNAGSAGLLENPALLDDDPEVDIKTLAKEVYALKKSYARLEKSYASLEKSYARMEDTASDLVKDVRILTSANALVQASQIMLFHRGLNPRTAQLYEDLFRNSMSRQQYMSMLFSVYGIAMEDAQGRILKSRELDHLIQARNKIAHPGFDLPVGGQRSLNTLSEEEAVNSIATLKRHASTAGSTLTGPEVTALFILEHRHMILQAPRCVP